MSSAKSDFSARDAFTNEVPYWALNHGMTCAKVGRRIRDWNSFHEQHMQGQVA